MAETKRAAEIGAQGISKVFGRFTALEDVSLSIGRGEFVTLLGPSGSGKTTFLMVLAGFEKPSAGHLTLDGRDVTQEPAEQRAFGMVFQGYALFPHMSVEDNIAFPLKVQKRSAAEVRRRVLEMVEMVGLGGHGHKRPSALSGGQQQRVALARALACEPPVLLLDEPFSALDKNLRGQMQDEVKRLHRETGTTFIFVTHDQSEALALSSRVAIFERGRLQQIAAPREVYERPANRFVAEFLGDINILPLEGVSASGPFAEGRCEGRVLRALPPGNPGGNPGGQPGGLLAIRPEYMALAATAPADGNAISARVADLTYLGSDTRISLTSVGGIAMTMTKPTNDLPDGLSPGAQVWVTWPVETGIFL